VSTKSRRVEIRLSEKEFQELNKAAEKSGMSVSEYIRRGIGEKREPLVIPDELRLAIKEMNSIGINLNQLVLLARTHFYSETKINRCLDDINESRAAIIKIIMSLIS